MSKKLFSSLFLLLASLFAAATEFWLEPLKFRYQVGEEMKMDFREGDAFTGELWDIKKNGAELMQWYSFAGVKDLTKTVKPTRGANVVLKFPVSGTQLFVIRSKGTLRKWGMDRFDEFLKEQEFNEILELRKGTVTSTDSVTEEYIRYAKLLVQVGDRADDSFKRKTGQRLEIIPAKNPYLLKTGDYLQCQVLFDGKPLPNALVKVWNRLNRTTFLQNIYSEKDGTIVFPISTKGAWMVSTAKMATSEKPSVEWQSLWGSLVFGI